MKIASSNLGLKINSVKKYSKASFLDCPKDTFELKNSDLNFRGVKKSFFEKIGLINPSKDLAIRIIQEEYEKLSQKMEQDFKSKGLVFQRPKLEFKNLALDINAGYHMWDNSIVINSKKLSIDNWYKSKKSSNLFLYLNPAEVVAKKDLENITSDEYRLIIISMLTHELQHSKQIQTVLNMPNSKELFIKSVKVHYNMPDEEIRRLFPFVFDFDSIDNLKADNFVFQNNGLKQEEIDFLSFDKLTQFDDGGYVLIFSPEVILNSMLKINKDDDEYFENLSELDALIAEYQALSGVKKANIDNDTLGNFIRVKQSQIKKIFERIYKKENVNV